jgi:hypothetical protein
LLPFSSSSSPCNSATATATTKFSSSPAPDLCTLFSTDSGDAAAAAATAAAATISSHNYNTQHTALLKPIIILHHIPHTHCNFPRLSVSFSLSSLVSHSLDLPLSLSQQQNTNSLRRQSLSLGLCDQAQWGEKNCFQLNEIFEEIFFPDFLIPCLLRSLLFHPILVEGIIAMVRIKACASTKFVERASTPQQPTNTRAERRETDWGARSGERLGTTCSGNTYQREQSAQVPIVLQPCL